MSENKALKLVNPKERVIMEGTGKSKTFPKGEKRPVSTLLAEKFEKTGVANKLGTTFKNGVAAAKYMQKNGGRIINVAGSINAGKDSNGNLDNGKDEQITGGIGGQTPPPTGIGANPLLNLGK